ncbi:MAG TPA: hypothetical protein VKX17_14440 [Planctomycetota bacterium]|nr:hypothetical protein [Planctomycetota bacterium]
MPYKVFTAPTGSGNIIFEGDVLNGYTSPDGKKVALKFFSNDRGYTCAAYDVSADDAKGLRDELAQLLEANASNMTKFQAASSTKHFTLTRELDNIPLILGCIGTDPRFGSCYHRGDAAAMQKVLAEFDTVLKTIADVQAGKGPTA